MESEDVGMKMILTEIQWEGIMIREIVEVILGERDGLLFALVMFMVIAINEQI